MLKRLILRTSRICKNFDYRSDGYDDDTDDLLHRLLALNPEKRITVEDAMAHNFFDSIRHEH